MIAYQSQKNAVEIREAVMNSFWKIIGGVAYAWLIIIGAWGLLFTPHGPIVICIACGSSLETIISVISIALGIGGIISRTAPSAAGSAQYQ